MDLATDPGADLSKRYIKKADAGFDIAQNLIP